MALEREDERKKNMGDCCQVEKDALRTCKVGKAKTR